MARSSAGTESNPSHGRPTSNANTPGDVASPFAPAPSTRGNLPSPPTRFIGREREVEEVRSLILDESVRLLTLTGPGGVGKTRLVIAAAHRLQPEFEDGAFYVPLATLTDPKLVATLIAQALGLREEGAVPVTEILEQHLRTKEMLLLLDNFEHLVATAPDLAQLLIDAPGLQLLVTSRTPLHVPGEHLYEVTPLSAPEDEELAGMSLDALARYEALALFTDRAQSVKPGFNLTPQNAPAVARICRRLDGLPLGIELAAARIRLFSPPALLARLTRSLPLLTGGAPQIPARHETLRDTIAWSYNLLDPIEQTLFTRLSVFSGGCTFDAAAYIARDLGLEDGRLLDRLLSLIDKSLLRQREQPDGEPRFWMLATIREFALEKLVESGQLRALRDDHARFYFDLAERVGSQLQGPQQKDLYASLERDHDNFRAALSHLLPGGDVEMGARLATALGLFWFVQGHYTEGRKWLDMAVDAIYAGAEREANESVQSISWRAEALRGAGRLAYVQNDYERAASLTRRGLEVARKLGDGLVVARLLNNLGTILEQQGDLIGALPFFEESFAIRRDLGLDSEMALSLNNLALTLERQGDYERAYALINESIEKTRALGEETQLAQFLYNRGRIAFRQGDLEQAAVAFSESLSIARSLGFKMCEMWALSELGMVLCEQGDGEGASVLFSEALAMARQAGDLTEISWIRLGQARLHFDDESDRARLLLQESLSLRVQLREYNLSTLDTIEWLAGWETANAVRQANREEAVRATLLYAACDARREAMGAPISRIWRSAHRGARERLRLLLGGDSFGAAWLRGREIPIEEAAALGLRDREGVRGAEAPPSPHSVQAPENELQLTAREIDVLGLLAQGLTNKEIAERLTLSHRTVQAHLYTIFSKLNVTTRSAAALAAIRHGLVR